MPAGPVHPESFLLVTIDSCRYDTAQSAKIPNIAKIGPLHAVYAPGTFTYSSHASMFMGFTPGDPSFLGPYLNPKFGRIFRMEGPGSQGPGQPFVVLGGRNVVEGFRRRGYRAFGTGGVAWFDPARPTSRTLIADFDDFYYPGNTYSLARQLEFVDRSVERESGPVFVFINIGETHQPYFHEGAPWDRLPSPCLPFGDSNDATECARRQRACLEFVDGKLGPLLERFEAASTIVCADHGDAWGEDGLWEHGIHHPKVLEVPLLFRLGQQPGSASVPLARSVSNALDRWQQTTRVKGRKAIIRLRGLSGSRRPGPR